MSTRRIGSAASRIDARDKVCGTARYASDIRLAHTAHAVLVTSAIARGRILAFEPDATRAVKGLLDLLTYENVGPLAQPPPPPGGKGKATTTSLESERIWHAGQIIAVVVAETLEGAVEAAQRLQVRVAAEAAAVTFDAEGALSRRLADLDLGFEEASVGRAEQAWSTSACQLEAHYSTPTQHHNPIELFTTTCVWEGERLTIYEPSQFVRGLAVGVAHQLGIAPERVSVRSEFVGGAFGARGGITQRTAWIAIAAQRLGRPVKLVATRSQGFSIATYRAETRHHLRLGATREGRLTALLHEGWEATSRPADYYVAGTETTARLYACPNVDTRVHIVHLDRNTPGFMRAPPETPYMFALECAMDELAVTLGLDPIELRRRNDATADPIRGGHFTSKSLMACFDHGAAAFQWSRRRPEPRSMRAGDWLIGLGCAAAAYPANTGAAAARIEVAAGRISVQIGAHEIGTGTYTAIALTAADRLQVPLERIEVQAGTSDLPVAGLSAGSSHAAAVCNAVALACDRLRSQLERTGATLGDSTLSLSAEAEYVPQGLAPDALRRLEQGGVAIARGTSLEGRIAYAFGAQFAEVHVHLQTGEVRVPRAVGAFAAGTIINPTTARSQLMGGMIWGISAALHEATEIDTRLGRYVNTDLAEYLIPVNADIHEIEVLVLPESDREVNPLGIKGVGELGIVGMNAAVANAVFHATGRRIRALPIRLEQLLL